MPSVAPPLAPSRTATSTVAIDPPHIAARLRAALTAARLSQATVARATGLSKSTVSRIFAEGDCWLSDLVRICRVLSVDPVDLITGNAPAAIEARAIVDDLAAFSPAEQYYVRLLLEHLAELRAATVDTILSAVRSPIARIAMAAVLSLVLVAANDVLPTATARRDPAVTAAWWPHVR